ncbi:MAG: YfhO family protein [Actinomycetota bacterium]
MGSVLTARRLTLAIALGVVVFAFWPALLGGGSLVGDDIVATAPPYDAYQPANFSLETGPGDTINIHAHWASLAEDLRSGDAGWWNPDLAAGQPTMKGGAPIFQLPYLVTPSWYAPGLVAAVRAFTAILLSIGFLRSVGLRRVSALAGGLAFGFSGFMVGWMNWPHSSVAALAPGLLWAIERMIADPKRWRLVPLGVVVGLMVWANFPSVLIYVLLGAVLFALVRVASEVTASSDRRRWLTPRIAVIVGGAVLAALMAAPHLIGFSEYIEWSDTSHRVGNPDDSSAGVAYLLTAIAPAIWGSDAVGDPWFGEGNWIEFNTHVGASVLLLAGLGLVAGVLSADRRRRSVALGLLVVAFVGVLVAYVGGPIGVALGDLTGSQGGLMTRAKVLISVGIALGAALGVEWLSDDVRDRRRVVRGTLGVVVLLGLAMLPSILDWLDAARAAGTARSSIAASSASMIAFAAVVMIVVARFRGALDATRAAWGLVVVVAAELLAFAMPVPTIVSRDERLDPTPAHEFVQGALAPGERLAGEQRTFFPATTQHDDIPDARGQLLKSAGYQELLRAVDPDMLRRAGGGTPTNPNIAIGTDPYSPVWDALAVGLWAQYPDTAPPGTRLGPSAPVRHADAAIQPLTATTVVPEGGLRGVTIDVAPIVDGTVEIEVTTEDGTVREERVVAASAAGVVSVAVLGEHLPVGTPVGVRVTAPTSTTLVGVDDEGALAVGTIAGDDGLELVRVGDVILLDRPVAPVRLAHAAIVEPDPAAAATAIAAGLPPGVAVVDRDIGLLDRRSDAAAGALRDVEYERGRVSARVETAEPVLLVVSEADYPGWRVTIDGASAEVVTADAAFLAVVVPEGAHDVEFVFEPGHLRAGMLSLLLAAVVIVGVMADAVRRGDLRSPLARRG